MPKRKAAKVPPGEVCEWGELGVPAVLIRGLLKLGYAEPTPIQRRSLPLAIRDKADIIGAAETGSGKTLAFALPILTYILDHAQLNDEATRRTVTSKQMQKIKTVKNEELKSGNVIDLNVVLHSLEEGKTAPGNLTEVGEIEDDQIKTEDADSAGDDKDDTNGSASDEVFDEESGSPDPQPPSKKKQRRMKKLSAYQQLRERHKKQKDLGFVGVKDNIPDDQFQLMLQGEVDVWGPEQSASSPPAETDGHMTADSVDEAHCESESGLFALILTPTRELAMQVHSHVTAVAKYTNIKVVTLVGGMAIEKQERLLNKRPQVVVATPGRLWQLMTDGHPHLCHLDNLRFLVLDEADRMIEHGHYRELSSILDRVNGARGQCEGPPRQTLVFSATLTLPRRTTERKRKKKNLSSQETIDCLISRVDLREDAQVVDLTGSKVTVQTLTETKITCTNDEKDVYLYHFLLSHPGRTIVFVNSIDCLQRLRSLLELLDRKPHPLHAQMQQRQRLKNLDRFTSCDSGVLLASDVAARGLDLPAVDYILHYQAPRNSELYVHRSGRTARAQKKGLSVLLVGPEDLRCYRNICKTLKREEIPNLPVDHTHLHILRERVSLAKQIHTIEYRRGKAQRGQKWEEQTAVALGVLLDKESSQKVSWGKEDEGQLRQLKDGLQQLLLKPLLPHGLSFKFPTQDYGMLTGLTRGHSSPEDIIIEEERAKKIRTS